MSVKMNGRHLAKFVADDEFDAIFPAGQLAKRCTARPAPAAIFWAGLDLPVDYDKEEFARIKAAAKIQSDSDACSSSSESAAAIWAPAPAIFEGC